MRASVKGCKLILQRLVQPCDDNLPIVLTGDFNSNPDTAAYHLLQTNGFEDAYRVAGHEDKEYTQVGLADSEYSNTVHAYGWSKPSSSGAKIAGSMRFDWILLRDPQRHMHTTWCDIIRDAQPPLYPSDHYPVLAIVDIK
jgi:endonuclease/exonuclease/phosphatase family metal-dependent hydrolase